MARKQRPLLPRHLVGLAPFGWGHQHPNNYLEIWKAIAENRDSPGRAMRIMREGVCDGCALGTSGLHDWTMSGVHLCNIRLRLLRLNTMGPFDPAIASDVPALARLRGDQLRNLGRIPCPMIRRRGDTGFTPVSWPEAVELIATRIRKAGPERSAYFLTSRGIPNETYYAVQKAVRAMGGNSIDNAARVCHSPSTVVLKQTIGVGASTCSYKDWMEADLIVFIGSNVANNQPVATKYLHYAKKRGTRVVSINTYREPGMESYWVPSVPSSALFGTRITDRFHIINPGGDVAFLNGAMKHMIGNRWLDDRFIADHTTGFDELTAVLDVQPWELLERGAGVTRAEMAEFAHTVGQAKRAVIVWSMGITQHAVGEDNVRAIVNLALLKGFVGHIGSGLMPIRGHSGVQGGAEMGAYATALPGGVPINAENCARLSGMWGFEVPATPGLTAPEMVDAAARGDLDVLVSMGGNFLEVLPDPQYVREALSRIALRVHYDIVLSSQMLVEPADTVLLLPATTRYEIPGGVTETSTERRVIFSPCIDGGPVAQAQPEGDVLLDVARRVRPDRANSLHFGGTAGIRAEIARVIPQYDGIQHLSKRGDQFQYGGRILCRDGLFPTADHRARFTPVAPTVVEVPDGWLQVTTRRGKQFNSMVQEPRDPITGAQRDAVFMHRSDAEKMGLHNGEPIMLRNDFGTLTGQVFIARVKPGSVQVHFPEGNVLIDPGRRSTASGIPDYNAIAFVERVPAVAT
jgi:molybdopterin-dependent oxidoreductase alpha subunit